MAVYIYDEEADALYISLVEDEDEEDDLDHTEELGPNLHADLDSSGTVLGVEFLHPATNGVDADLVKQRYGIDLKIPFTFGA